MPTAELLWSYVPVFFYRYAVMLNCWKYESASRPHFVKLYQTMDTYIKTKVCHTASNSGYTSAIEIGILPSQLRISFLVNNVMSERINYPAANNLWIQFHHEPMLLFKHMQVWLRHVSLDHPYFPSVVYTQERTEQILK